MYKYRSKRKVFIGPMTVVLLLCLLFSSIPFSTHNGIAFAADSIFYDFVNEASKASWESGAGSLPFPGSDNDSRGFALYRDKWQLEDNSTRARALETHPQWVSNGWIMGRYPELTVPSNAELKVTVGFFKGATGSDGVTFEVKFEEFLGLTVAPKTYSIVSHVATYDGKLESISEDLSSLAGKTGNFILYVNAGQNSGQDWAAWAEAKIEVAAPPALPDLIVEDVWQADNTIRYKIKNVGEGSVVNPPGGTTPFCNALFIDGELVAKDCVNIHEMLPGQSIDNPFDYDWEMTPPEHAIQVCADWDKVVEESNEQNNCLEKRFKSADTTPPVVTITQSPSQVTTLDEVIFTAQAKDDSGIARILIFVNQEQVKECTSGSERTDAKGRKYWECIYTGGPYDEETLTYRAEAIDGYNNRGFSSEESVDVSLAIVTPPPIFQPCLYHITGKIMDFPYPPEMLKIELCEAEQITLSPELGGATSFVCKPGGVFKESALLSHNTHEFQGLCPGTYKVNPIIQPGGDICQPEGMFWNQELTWGGPRIVNVPEEDTADFVFVPRETSLPEVDISFSPENPTTEDEIQLIVSASDVSGIGRISIEGQIDKVRILRGRCRTERYEGHEVEICEEEEYKVTETISQQCDSSPCIYTIPRIEADFERYELSLSVMVWDRICNKIVLEQSLEIYKPTLLFPRRNVRNISAYRTSETFMVSDRDWRTVLSLVPIAYGRQCPEDEYSRYANWWPAGIYEMCSEPQVIKYPLLIFHQEADGAPYYSSFDIDSAVHFMDKYPTRHLTVFVGNETINHRLDDLLYYWLVEVGNFPWSTYTGWYSTSPRAEIRFFDASDISEVYNHYFSEINSVIVCQDDYKAALLASVFAAAINTPLYFDGHFALEDIEDKVVHIVGDVRPETRTLIQGAAKELGSFVKGTEVIESPYSLEDIRFRGVKSILVSPYDLDTSYSGTIRPTTERSFEVRTFGNNSLAAPILAAATHRNIYFSPYDGMFTDDSACGSSPTHDQLKSIIDDIKREYHASTGMVIVASPAHIPDSYYTGCVDDYWQTRHEVDREYGASGRIYGLTVTDTSAYIARDIFYHDIMGTQDVIPGLIISHTIAAEISDAESIFDDLSDSPNYDVTGYIPGYSWETDPPANEYLGKNFIIFADHGGPSSWCDTLESGEIPGIENDRNLRLPVVFGEACLTNNFWQGGAGTMGPNWIRRGAIAYFGAVGVSQYWECGVGSWTSNPRRWMSEILEEENGEWRAKSLGALSDSLAHCHSACCGPFGHCWVTDCDYRNKFILLGDPWLSPNFLPED